MYNVNISYIFNDVHSEACAFFKSHFNFYFHLVMCNTFKAAAPSSSNVFSININVIFLLTPFCRDKLGWKVFKTVRG